MATITTNTKQRKTKRQWIYAKKPSGQFFNYRQWVGYFLLIFLFVAPFIKIKGEPFLMFNIIDRKFVIFGSVFWPQDLHIFVFGMLIIMVCVVLFTVVYGRIWCGWACPQTIFMELIFRRIEYWIEGDWQKQKKAKAGPKDSAYRFRKFLKHSIFFLISFFISNIFLAYIIGVDALWAIITDPISQHIGGLISILLFTLVFYFVFAYVREIVCTTICPYGRLQGVLMDDQTLTIAYDYKRGEPRGHRKKGQVDANIGDCVDCNLCVQVCPTGIDIRNGTQLECVNCTACIDACDDVMVKLGRPKRLIGFYSALELAGEQVKKSNTRAIAYTVVLVALMGVFSWMIFSRAEVDGTMLRAKGSTYQLRDDGTVTNLYSLELINKKQEDLQFTLVPEDQNLSIQLINQIGEVKGGTSVQLSFFLIAPQGALSDYKNDIRVQVVSEEGQVVETLKSTFISPSSAGEATWGN